MKTMQVRIEGRVQGVYFRDYTRREALALGVDGWVRNCQDGSVEAVISGPENAVAAMLDWFQVGSPHARVLAVKVKEITPPQAFPDFQIRY
jgi:acylphosphatase